MMRRSFFSALALCGITLLTAAANAADKPTKADTVMTVGEMCGGCVKKIEKKLKPMDGVASVRCDIQAKTVTVHPKPKVTLSAKTLWEAMAEIGKTPQKLVGPGGTFTEKPKS